MEKDIKPNKVIVNGTEITTVSKYFEITLSENKELELVGNFSNITIKGNVLKIKNL